MKRFSLFLLLLTGFALQLRADRIYIFPGTGYNQCDPPISNAISSLGHTVVLASNFSTTLPPGFTSACVDPVNGYHWLCFFGDVNYTALSAQIKTFIDNGGKVFYQYEVSCCVTSSSSAASVASFLTGLNITPDANPSIAGGSADIGSWESINVGGSCVRFVGNAYKCLNGLPPANQLNATATLNGAWPPHTTCQNFGFYFSGSDFTGTANTGAFTGIGDINIWYDSSEPPNNGGTQPVNMNVVNFFFPPNNPPCVVYALGVGVDAGNDTSICGSATVQLNAVAVGAPSFTYSWNPSAGLNDANVANPVASPTTTTTYIVTATAQNGCGVVSDTIVISVGGGSVNAGADVAVVCGSSTQLNATSPFSITSYSWSPVDDLDNPAIANPVATPTQTRTYTVSVTDVNGCTATDAVTVSINSISVDAGQNQTLGCAATSVQLNATSPATGLTYAWTPPASLDNPAIANPVASPTATTTYTVTVQNTAGCSASDTVRVTVGGGNITITETHTDVSCNGEADGSINITVSGATSPAYVWSNGLLTEDISGVLADIYSVTVTEGNCSATLQVTVDEPLIISLSAIITNANCNGATDGAINLTASGGTPTYQYAWSTGLLNEDLPNVAAGNYTVTVTDFANCTATGTYTVGQATSINVSHVTSPISCNGGNDGAIDVSVTGGATPYDFLWSGGATSEDLSALHAGTYTITITDALSCTVADTITLVEPTLVTVTITEQNISCFGENDGEAQATASGGDGNYSYAWSTNPQQTTPAATGLAAGNFSVTVSDASGCTASANTNITEPAAFTISLDSLFQITRGESVMLATQTTATNVTYSWSPADALSCLTCSAPAASPLQTTAYTVTAQNANGCADTASTLVVVVAVPDVAVPTAFSPNDDGRNDVFKILNATGATGTMKIFNRWGEMIFETTNLTKGWDGFYKEEPAEIGVYAYMVEATLSGSAQTVKLKGNVTLVR